MSTATLKLSGRQNDYVVWALLGLGAVAVGYVLIKYVLPKLGGAAASGTADTLNAINQGFSNNELTTSQTDAGGDSVDYSGHGVLSTLGAEANSLSGGIFASIGETLGGWFANLDEAGTYTPYAYQGGRVVQVQDQGTGKIYNVDSNGNITGPAS